MKVWIDGTTVDGSQASISVLDHGLLYGDGIFEGIRALGGYVLDLELHLERLVRSARGIGMQLGEWIEQLPAIVLDTLSAQGDADGYARLVVTRGTGPLGLDPSTCSGPKPICIADRLTLYSGEAEAAGVRLITSSWRW